jgi:hypothetical protein
LYTYVYIYKCVIISASGSVKIKNVINLTMLAYLLTVIEVIDAACETFAYAFPYGLKMYAENTELMQPVQ